MTTSPSKFYHQYLRDRDRIDYMFKNRSLNPLTISSASTTAAKFSHHGCTYYNNGTLVTVAPTDDGITMPADTITNAETGLWLISGDSAGTITVTSGTVDSGVVPSTPAGNTALAVLTLINNSAGNYVGATTDTSTAGLIWGVSHINFPREALASASNEFAKF